ncbi:MAG: ribose-phosphate pyrophosphokinase [Limnochordaceae bacterium]|nr:ribose-phosphate pyrophosphokinase [Limnochordaceae bacterium]
MLEKQLHVFSGTANRPLAEEIASYMGVPLGKATIGRFKDGEINVRIGETVRGADCFVVQPTCSPSNDNLMELLIMIDAIKRASARSVAAVIPYYGYARQDRKAAPRDPIAAKLVANLLTAAGADRVLTMDLHAPQIQGFFDIPVDNLMAGPILADYFRKKELESPVVVSPDVGGVSRARELAQRLHTTLAIVDKRRPAPNVSEVMNVIGDVHGKVAILVDDIIDTAGTIVQAAQALLDRGACTVYACCTHPVFSPPALERLVASPLQEVVVTNTIPRRNGEWPDKIKTLSVAPLFGEAIRRIFHDESVSVLFD